MLGILRHVFRTGFFHCVKDRILGVMGGRCRPAFFQFRFDERVFKAFFYVIRQHAYMLGRFFHDPAAGASPEGLPDPLPAHLGDCFPFQPERTTCAFQNCLCFIAGKRQVHRTEEPGADQGQQVFHAGRKRIDCLHSSRHGIGGNDRVMVRYLTIVDDLVRAAGNIQSGGKGQGADDPGRQLWKLRFHIVRQKTAVGARIGDQLLFIQSLGVFQRLLGRKPEDSVGVPLKGGQVIEKRRVFGPLPVFYPLYDGGRTAAGVSQRLCSVLVPDALRMSGQPFPKIKLYDVERFRFKMIDPLLPFRQHGQRRGHDPSDVQCGAVQKGV